jgi:pyruvate,water dikinase
MEVYIKKFGDRRPSELILESPRMTENPEMLISLIGSYLKVDIKNSHEKKDTGSINELKKSIKQANGFAWGFIYSLLIDFIASYTRNSIKYRELFRIKRALVYGVARDCFMVLAEKYVSANIIEKNDDIFYLTTSEIISIAKNNSPESDYKKIIMNRKEIWLKYENSSNLPQRLKIIGIGPNAQIISDVDELSIRNEYSGMPTSCGIIRGRVIVLKKFDANIDVKNKIVVTYQTDPGWSLMFPLIKGIILEKGNSLSHAAILSRELGIPSIVKVDGIVDKLMDGDLVELDGNSGIIKLIQE